MLDSQVVYLNVAHYARCYVNGTGHYYGFLQRGDGKNLIQIIRRITQIEANQLNEEEFGRYTGPEEDLEAWGRYKPGDESGRFWDLPQLIQAAIDIYHRHFPDAILLIHGNRCSADPQSVLIGPEIDQLNDIVRRCKANGWWKNKKVMESLCQEWEQIMESI